MTKIKRKKLVTRASERPEKKSLTNDQKWLAEFDRNLGRAFLEVNDKDVSQNLIIEVAARHTAEFGCWRSDGAAPLVAVLILNGVATHLKKYINDDLQQTAFEDMEILIQSEWLEGSDGRAETAELLTAMQDHICQWIGMSLDSPNSTSDTVH